MNSHITWLVFWVTIIELVILVVQIAYYLQRPSDKPRLWYLVLLYMLIQYNIVSGIFPDPNIDWISVPTQNILAYASGIVMSIYFIVYLYLAFNLKHLRYFLVYGTLLMILLPFAVLFIAVYLVYQDLAMARQLFVVLPFLYAVAWLYYIHMAFKAKFKSKMGKVEIKWKKEQMIVVYAAYLFWITLPLTTFFNASQILEQGMTNAGFLFMTIAYARIQVQKSRYEYKRNLVNEKELEIKNDELDRKNAELTESSVKVARLNEFIKRFKKALSDVHYQDREAFRPLVTFINEDWDILGEMEYFDSHFEAVHSELFQMLGNQYPELSLNDKKHMVYAKIGLSNKEIAAFMSTSMDALKMQRYRIKQSIGLAKDVNFRDFIHELSVE